MNRFFLLYLLDFIFLNVYVIEISLIAVIIF